MGGMRPQCGGGAPLLSCRRGSGHATHGGGRCWYDAQAQCCSVETCANTAWTTRARLVFQEVVTL